MHALLLYGAVWSQLEQQSLVVAQCSGRYTQRGKEAGRGNEDLLFNTPSARFYIITHFVFAVLTRLRDVSSPQNRANNDVINVLFDHQH